MMDWEDVRVQLIDTPPITPDYLEGYLSSMVRTADACVLVARPRRRRRPVRRRGGRRPAGRGQDRARPASRPPRPTTRPSSTSRRCSPPTRSTPTGRPTGWRSSARCSPTASRSHARRRVGHRAGRRCATRSTSSLGRDPRLHASGPASRPTWTRRSPAPSGSTVAQLAELVHRDFAEKLKSARIWGTGVFDGQTVTRDHVLHDKDVVELHV